MSRLAIQILFVILSASWAAYVAIHMFSFTFGDCGEDSCERYREAMRGMIFWRGACITLLMVLAYRLVRKEPNA